MSCDDYKDRVPSPQSKLKCRTFPSLKEFTHPYTIPLSREKSPLGKSLSLPSFRQQFLISISKFVLPVLELYLIEPYNIRSFMSTLSDQHNFLRFTHCFYVYQQRILFYCSVVFHFMTMSKFVHSFLLMNISFTLSVCLL